MRCRLIQTSTAPARSVRIGAVSLTRATINNARHAQSVSEQDRVAYRLIRAVPLWRRRGPQRCNNQLITEFLNSRAMANSNGKKSAAPGG